VEHVAAEESRPRHLGLPDYIRILSKRKWFILIVTAVGMLVGGLLALSSERLYEATSLVIIQQRPQGFFWVTGEEAGMPPNVAMETHARIVRSSDVTQLASEKLQQLPTDSRVIATSTEIQDALNVSVIEPDLLRIDATSPDRRRALLFANYTAFAFVERNLEDRQRESRDAREFLERQVAQYGTEVESIIEEMTAFARDSGFVDIDSEIGQAVQSLAAYENEERQAQRELMAAEARLAELRQVRGSQGDYLVGEAPAPNPEWTTLQASLTEARIGLEKLQSQYTGGNPLVLDQQALVEELAARLADTPQLVRAESTRANPATTGIEGEIKAAGVAVQEARARVAAAQGVLGGVQERIKDLPDARQQWQGLTDRLDAAREAYLSLQGELRQARLSEAVKKGNARVVDQAQEPREIQTSLLHSLLFALAIGLFIGVGLSILLEALDDTIYSVDDLQRVSDLYLLGVVPLHMDDAGPLVTVDAPKSPSAEAYRTLRSNIRFSLFDRPARTFLITSAGSGEGKSVTTANLAVAQAHSGLSVILVDADLRRPVQHKLFGVPSEVGVTNVVVGDMSVAEALTPTEVPGLRLLTSGPVPPNPAELLESEQMTAVIQELTQLADLVIFDSPPAVMLTDATVLAAKLDRTIVVAESGQITERALADVERLFRHARADILGIVLNKLRITGGDYHYYYYYYSDYSEEPQSPRGARNASGSERKAQDLIDLNSSDERGRDDLEA